MKKILVLGVGNAQVDFIKYCREYGLMVHACSYKNEGRGIKESDQFHLVNITDVDGLKAIIRKHQIDILYSVGSDLAMPTIAQVTAEMNMFGFVSPETATICNHKPKLRDHMCQLKNGIYSVPHAKLIREQDLRKWNRYPAIVKPAKSQGQRGISKVNNAKEFEKSYRKAIELSSDRQAIVEEFVDGFEVSVNSYLLGGQPLFYFVTERNSFQEYPGGIIKSHRFPVTSSYNENKLKDLVTETCQHLHIIQGPVYFQIKITNMGEPKLIEVTPRLDGCHLWRLLKMLDGPDLFQFILNQLTGKTSQPYKLPTQGFSSNKTADLFFFTQPPDTYMNKDAHKKDNIPNFIEWYYENGEKIRKINGYQEKVGYQITIY